MLVHLHRLMHQLVSIVNIYLFHKSNLSSLRLECQIYHLDHQHSTYVRSTLQPTRAWYNGYNADWLYRRENNTTSNNLMTTPYDINRCMDVKEIHNA